MLTLSSLVIIYESWLDSCWFDIILSVQFVWPSVCLSYFTFNGISSKNFPVWRRYNRQTLLNVLLDHKSL